MSSMRRKSQDGVPKGRMSTWHSRRRKGRDMWPSGARQKLNDVHADQFLEVREPELKLNEEVARRYARKGEPFFE